MVDRNVHRVLNEMAGKEIRGTTASEVAYKILEEWIWNNSDRLRQMNIDIEYSEKTDS